MLAVLTHGNMTTDTRTKVCGWLYSHGVNAAGLRGVRVLTPTEIQLDVYECDDLGNRIWDGEAMEIVTHTVALTLHEPIPADVLAVLPGHAF